MATKAQKPQAKRKSARQIPRHVVLIRRVRAWVWRGVFAVAGLIVFVTVLYAFVNPPTTPYMFAEGRHHGPIVQDWVPMDRIAPVMARSAVAAEDANFCLHWGLDVKAIRDRLETGGNGGASTISQQTIKNVYLWHGRSWVRKAAEALWTPLAEAVWSKRRMLEIYLNVAEFDTGVFGVEAAARHYFGVSARDLSAQQAARLAAILPDPKGRSAADPSNFVRRRAAAIMDGAATIAADGRAACFEG